MTDSHIHEPARSTAICHEADVCVIGGSTTGVFAALAAARLGARVAVVEAMGYFGGTATASLVNVWHSHFDEPGDKQIIAGLVVETMDRLKRRDAVIDRGHNPHWQYSFQPFELVCELDELVGDQKLIRPFLHARFVEPIVREPGVVDAVVIEDKSGRRAIRAGLFIDASGDGDLIHRAGLATYQRDRLQPPTTCAVVTGLTATAREMCRWVFDPDEPGSLRPGFLWASPMPGEAGAASMIAGTRVHGADCSDADQLTAAEIEGRRQVRALLDIVRRKQGDGNPRLQGLPARIGIRETRHARCLHELTEREVLSGERFDDAIANGSYRVDVHAADGDGLVFRYLDGRELTVYADGRSTDGRWAVDGALPGAGTFYQIPYRSLVPQGAVNVLAAGRCIDADEGAFGAIRVMVNAGQMGEAAGVAAEQALSAGVSVDRVDPAKLRATLGRQGAVVV